MMTRLDRYIFFQILNATLLAILVFIIFWISPEILFKVVKQSMSGQITALQAFKLLYLQIPEILGKAIPIGLMIGSLFVFDRLSNDSEVTVLRALGVSIYRMAVPIIFISILGVVACFYTNEKLIISSAEQLSVFKNDISQDYFVFVDKTDAGKPKNILIIGNYDGKQISNIKFLHFSDKISADKPIIEDIITASSANYKKDHWKLNKGMIYKIAPDGVYKSINKFTTVNVLSSVSSKNAYKLLINSTKRTKEMTYSELERYSQILNKLKIDDEYRYIRSKFYQRFAQPFSCLFLALCGVVLGISRPREKRFFGFTIGVALVFIYFVLIPFLDMLAQNAVLSPATSAWLPNIFIALVMFVLIKIKQI